MSFKINDIPINVTIFPDKTSQVWKLNEKCFGKVVDIEWEFDNEGEIIHLVQIVDLLRNANKNCEISLYLPYLPYARQDKNVSNTTSFALHSFAKLLNLLKLDDVVVLDPHSDVYNIINDCWKERPTQFINNTIDIVKPDVLCYPDAGAKERYSYVWHNSEPVYAEKTRDPLTGHLSGCKLFGDVLDKNVLIIDDLIDGGGTFINLSKELYNNGAKEVNLYGTHGIFSKGLGVLLESGIKRIFTKDGEYIQGNSNYYEYGTAYKPWEILK